MQNEESAAAEDTPEHWWTPEQAAEMGRRSGEAKRRKATMSPEERALGAIGDKLGRLTAELIHAALGEGDFEDLKLETRVTALQRLMEWRLGKAAAVKPREDGEPTAAPDGEALFEE